MSCDSLLNIAQQNKEVIIQQWKIAVYDCCMELRYIQQVFEKKNAAFFRHTAQIVNDIYSDISAINYEVDLDLLVLKSRRIFESLLTLHWINRHSPKETYRQFAKEQIKFCNDTKQCKGLHHEAIAVLNRDIAIAQSGACHLEIGKIELKDFKHINFKDEATLAQLEGVYYSFYNSTSSFLHGGLFSTYFRCSQPQKVFYQNMLFANLLELMPIMMKELKQIREITEAYK